MSEQIIARLLDNKHKGSFSYDRKQFYTEQIDVYKETWKPSMAVSVVQIILFNESWDLIIQKRAKHKNHNGWLLDKSVWGHIKYWDPIDYTVMVETVEELQCPSLVVKEEDDFEKRLALLKDYVKTIALLSQIDSDTIIFKKIINDEVIEIANKIHLYFWVYWGRVKNVDKEAMWLLYYSFDELKDEMKQYPTMFTYELHYYIEHYESDIKSFIELIKKTLG